MKKKYLLKVLISLALSIMFLGSINNAYSQTINDDMNKAVLSAIGDVVAQIVEEKAGVPASSAGTIAGYFSASDLKNAFLSIVNLATDTAISAIPVVGVAKFAVSLESSLIKVWKTWLDWTEISYAWDIFKGLSDTEQKQWLNGEEISELDYSKATAYLERNGYNLRQLFEKYYDTEKQSKTYLEYVKKVSELLYDAKYLIEPELYNPNHSGDNVKLSDSIALWRNGNNFFRINISMPDGVSGSIAKKFSDTQPTFSFKLTDFTNINWSDYFTKYPEGVKVNFKVYAAIWDYTGLIEKLMGSEFVTSNEKILRNIPGQQSQIAQFNFSAVVINEATKQELNVAVNGKIDFDYEVVFENLYNVPGTESLDYSGTIHITCDPNGNDGAIDNDKTYWYATCNYENNELSSVKLSLQIGTGVYIYQTIYFNNGTCSSKISSKGVYISGRETYGKDENGETIYYYGKFSNFRGDLGCTIQ